MHDSWVELLVRDHETTERVLEAAKNAARSPEPPSVEIVGKLLDYLVGYVDGCHNQKEERHLFPLLEKRGIPRSGGPLAVMLAEHEQCRGLLAQVKRAGERYVGGDTGSLGDLAAALEAYTELAESHFWKENDILYPMGQRAFGEDDARAVVQGILAEEARVGPDTRARYYAIAAEIERAGALKDLAFNLSHEVIGAMLSALPVEISFVDADDRVRYFSHENRPKIFARTRGAIGTAVQSCHPQKSVHIVNKILADFKAGQRSVAEFWIDMGPKKIHIRYFPVHDDQKRYLGTMEVVQDVTPIQKLEGQRRLLDDA
jgi:DUF438 domain-containing protein